MCSQLRWGSTLTIVILSLLTQIPPIAATPLSEPTWEKMCYTYATVHGIQNTPDNCYITVGGAQETAARGLDVLLMKLDASGNELWHKFIGGAHEDSGTCIRCTPDGGYIITGYKSTLVPGSPSTGESDNLPGYDTKNIYLVKTDGKGNLVWERVYGFKDCEGTCVQVTSDGDYLVTGYGATGSIAESMYLIKVDPSGKTVWMKNFGQWTSGLSLATLPDGGFIVSGSINKWENGGHDLYLLRLDGSGNMLWERSYGGAEEDYGNSIQLQPDGSFIIVGVTKGVAWPGNIYIVKVNALGELVWEKHLVKGESRGESVHVTADGGFILAGYSTMRDNSRDVYLLKYDSSGNEVWEKLFGGKYDDFGYCVEVTPSEGYIVAGIRTTRNFGSSADVSNSYLVKTNSLGVVESSPSDNSLLFYGGLVLLAIAGMRARRRRSV